MVIKINERFRAIFLKFIKDSEKSYSSYNYSGYGGGYNYGGYSGYSNPCYRNGTLYIYFYEWSDMSRGNKVFRSAEDFYEFLAESKIVCTEEQKKIIENNSWCYATCVPRKKILMVENQYYTLKEKLEKCTFAPCTCLAPMYY